MKSSILLAAVVIAIFACSSHDIQKGQCLAKWELVAMTGNIAGVPPATGDNMSWQEHYILYPDSTFIKSRIDNEIVKEATGKYAMIILSDGKYLELTFKSDHEIIGNCSEEPKELLRFQTEDDLFSTWLMCDGPGLHYRRADCADRMTTIFTKCCHARWSQSVWGLFSCYFGMFTNQIMGTQKTKGDLIFG